MKCVHLKGSEVPGTSNYCQLHKENHEFVLLLCVNLYKIRIIYFTVKNINWRHIYIYIYNRVLRRIFVNEVKCR